ncbi:MAG: hypothetical protein Q8K75_06310 [Chlamydiales bacterium]|nr:hypothetical protein [Chlamydiales bacterium]
MKLVLLLYLLNMFFYPALSQACDHDNTLAMIAMEYKIVDNRIYLDPTQLLITNDGIFIFVNGQRTSTGKIAWDENGIYCLVEDLEMDRITDRCRFGHKVWCQYCWGCVVRDCPEHCRCMAWP